MKKIVLIASLAYTLQANSLENFLLKKDENINIGEKENIEYYVIGKSKVFYKAEKKDFHPFHVSGGIVPPSEMNPNQEPPTSKNYQATENMLLNIKSKVLNYANDEKKDFIKSIKTDVLEEIILKYFNIPKRISKYGLKEKISIYFDIDEKNNISNIQFIKPSSYEDINKEFKNAIIKSSQEIPTPNKKETKKLYYEFDI
jgi:hypothetical protein